MLRGGLDKQGLEAVNYILFLKRGSNLDSQTSKDSKLASY
jgi:hypothetical protein